MISINIYTGGKKFKGDNYNSSMQETLMQIARDFGEGKEKDVYLDVNGVMMAKITGSRRKVRR